MKLNMASENLEPEEMIDSKKTETNEMESQGNTDNPGVMATASEPSGNTNQSDELPKEIETTQCNSEEERTSEEGHSVSVDVHDSGYSTMVNSQLREQPEAGGKSTTKAVEDDPDPEPSLAEHSAQPELDTATMKAMRPGSAKVQRHVTYSPSVEELERRKEIVQDRESDNQVYRVVFRNEMHRLHRELEMFKEQIAKEYEKNARRIEKKRRALEDELRELEEQRLKARSRLEGNLSEGDNQDDEEEDGQADNRLDEQLARQHSLLDMEIQMLEKEEKLASRQRQLEEYEAEIEKVEGYLDRRMDIAKRRNTELIELDESQRGFLTKIANEMERECVDQADTDASNSAAQHPVSPVINWEAENRALQEKKAQTELVLKKTKADLARAENAREQLQKRVGDLEVSQRHSEKKISELERQLSLTHRVNLHPSTSNNYNQSQSDLQSAVGGSSNHHGAPVTTPPLPPTTPIGPVMKPVRFSMRIKPKNASPSLHSEPTTPTASMAPVDEQSQQDQYSVVTAQTERPALTWQRYPDKRRRSTLRPVNHSAPPSRQRRPSSSGTSATGGQSADGSLADLRATPSSVRSLPLTSQESRAGRSKFCVIQ